jgi:hypothetical protein
VRWSHVAVLLQFGVELSVEEKRDENINMCTGANENGLLRKTWCEHDKVDSMREANRVDVVSAQRRDLVIECLVLVDLLESGARDAVTIACESAMRVCARLELERNGLNSDKRRRKNPSLS